MGYQPWYTGQTFPGIPILLNTDAGPDNLTGVSTSNLSMVFHPTVGSDFTGTGTFTITSVNPAQVTYKPSVADVANVFNGSLVVTALFPPSNSTADEAVYDPFPFVITAR